MLAGLTKDPSILLQGLKGFLCLTPVGWLFTVVFTYTGFFMLIAGVLWSANLGQAWVRARHQQLG